MTAPGEVTFTFDQTGNRELPKILGQLMVLPQHWWEGTDANGKQRDIGASTLEPPMGSGPYKLAKLQRRPHRSPMSAIRTSGARTEPTDIGTNNFDTIRYEYFRDLDVAFEGFKGDQFDWWVENRAARWATGYDFPAVTDGRVVKELFPKTYMRLAASWSASCPTCASAMFQGPARPPGAELRLRLRGAE